MLVIPGKIGGWPRRLKTVPVSLVFMLTLGEVCAQVRPEIYPVQAVTLTKQQILRGEQDGKAMRQWRFTPALKNGVPVVFGVLIAENIQQ